MGHRRDHNRPVPLTRVRKALGRLMSSIQSLQRKISRLPRCEVLGLITCTKKDRKGQELEEWAVHGSTDVEIPSVSLFFKKSLRVERGLSVLL